MAGQTSCTVFPTMSDPQEKKATPEYVLTAEQIRSAVSTGMELGSLKKV
jgi:hypothetical protein